MCGIAAFSGLKGLTSDQARVATNKMKILGLFNQSRGTHGCGLYINGQIFKGIDDIPNKKNTKEFDDFISNVDFVWPELDLKSGHIMFLHTRQATAGAQVEANTHPFLIKSEDPRNNLVGVHNGTIENIWTLCNKYDVDHIGQHIHVDSKALYTLIDKVGLPILTEYKGAAALVWTKPSDPGSMYVYHGAARRDHIDTQSYEERPLWYMKAAEGIYFSSMPASLLAIRESSKQEIKFLEYNQVIKVTNGKFTASKTTIAREDANLSPIVVRTNYEVPKLGGFQYHRQREALNVRTILEASKRNEDDQIRTWRKDRNDKVKKDLKTPDTSLIWHETMPKKALAVREEDIVYYYRGRYYRSGGTLCENLIWVKDRGVIAEELDNGATAHWFFHGVAMKDQAAWEAVVQESKVPGGWAVSLDSNYAYAISRFSQYPVANMESEAIDKDDYFRFSWYFDARRINTKFTPKFSGRCYVIEDGFLVDITASNLDDKETYKLPKSDAEMLGEAELALEGASCPITGGCGQSLLPIRYKESVSSRKTGGSHDSPFDIIFDCKDGKVEEGLDELFKTYSPVEMEAMVRFISEKLTTQWQVKPTAQEVQAEMYNALRGGIKIGQSVRQCLGDDNLLLDSLCDIIAKNREENITEIDSIEMMINAEAADYNVTMGYAEDFYERNGYYPKGEPIVDAETSLSPFPDDLPFNDEPLIDGSLAPIVKILDDLDEVFLNRTNKIAREEEEHKLASRRTDEAIGGLSELCTIADELQSMTGSDYAIDVSQVLYEGVGHMKHKLAEVCEANHDPEAIRRMNTEITV